MPALLQRPDAVSRSETLAMRDALRDSPLLHRSPLGGTFRASRGFAVTFTDSGRSKLEGRLPELVPFLRGALVAPDLRPWPLRLFPRKRTPNAYFLNVLEVPSGAGVGRHVDGTLQRATGVPHLTPTVVSVLYLHVPDATGGRLRLFRHERPVASVTPAPGLLVHFDGTLAHEVEPLGEGAEASRLSVVCEQYVLSPEALIRVPEFQLDSRAGFEAYLADVRNRPAP